jgi:hypothetical protein
MHNFAFTGGKNVWNTALFQGYQFYNYFKYIPLAGGLATAIAQYLPETINKRLKLTFHLPLAGNNALLLMQAFGTGSLLVSSLIFLGLFTGFGLIYFPMEMVADGVITILPWLLAGLAIYFLVPLVILEPNRIFRFFYSLIGGFFLTIYFASADSATYAPAIPAFFILTALLCIAFVFSAYRFKKGEA